MTSHHFYTNASSPSFLDEVKDCLKRCKSFTWSVSFIKKAGLVLLEDDIEAALRRGAKGKILTSTYQNFTDIASLESFLSLQENFSDRFECHLEFNSFGEDGFHTKGYLFSFDEEQEVIIGSSNITRFALLKNKEWDVSVSTEENDPFLTQIKEEFDYLWKRTLPLDKGIVKRYQLRLEYAIEQWDMDYINPDEEGIVTPNLMQRKALKEISRTRSMGVDKALVIAATGSGKTYLAAFDAKNFNAKHLLFVVHKDTILVEAMKTFSKVFGKERTYGLYNGTSQDGLKCDFLFASNQMLLRHLLSFSPTEFDYIVIDEVHHAAAEGYQKILSYFKPQFLLGLTATPDRMDDKNIYELFGNNVPYDLRLREAMENHLIVPFKYYGIKDSLMSYADADSGEGVRKIIQESSSHIHGEFIREQIEKYRPKGVKLRAVGFCRSIEHARLMAETMAGLGYHTAYLTASSETGERLKIFHDLENEKNPLELLFTVDILNEGVDIPSLNMVLFLRPTESSTIFIQQLGRGLRKYPGKSYLTVLDFIANSYRRSVQIAMALGSLSKSGTVDKRTLASYIKTDFESVCCDIPEMEIHMDEESREEILRSIDSTNFNQIRLLVQDYQNFKQYLTSENIIKKGEYVKPTDFLKTQVDVDFLRYAKKFSSYYEFLGKADKDSPIFSEDQVRILRALNFFLPLVREEEYAILSSLLDGEKTKQELWDSFSHSEYIHQDSFEHALRVLEGKAVINLADNVERKLIKEENGIYSLTFEVSSESFLLYLLDALQYGIEKYESDNFGKTGLLHLYQKYTQPQSFLALNIYKIGTDEPNLEPMSGIQYTNKGLAIYVTLNKDLQKEERLKYKDRFLSNDVMQWESSTSTTLENGKGQKLISSKRAMVFVRKTKKEDGQDMPYVYLGWGRFTNPRVSDNPAKAILLDVVLEQKVPKDYLYDFGIKDAD